MKNKIAKSEWNLVALVIIILLVLTTLPYLFAYITSPADKQFMGIMLDVPDHAQYFSWMRELSQYPLASNKLTPEENAPVFFNLLWWGLGRIGRGLQLGFSQMYQVLRITSIVSFLSLAYYVCSIFLEDLFSRRLAFLMISFGSGLGWIWVIVKYLIPSRQLLFPLDLYVAEGNTFLGMLGYPHFISAALYIAVFAVVLYGYELKQLRYSFAAGLLALFFGFQHAYDLWLVYSVLLAFAILLLIRDKKIPWYMIWTGIIVGLLSVWPALYSYLLTQNDPIWKAVLSQFSNAGVYTPNILHLFILMGISFILAVFTFIKQKPFCLEGVSNSDLFIRGWFVVNFFLIYLPTDYQIHMLNGWQVPIAILAVQGLTKYIYPEFQKKFKSCSLQSAALNRLFMCLIILMIIPTNVYLLSWRFVDLSRHNYPYYLSVEEVNALRWLEKNVKSDDVVLSSLTFGQYVPAYTGAHAFLAHWAQTVDFYTKEKLVEAIYSMDVDETRKKEILNEYSVDYVMLGPAEKLLGTYALSNINELDLVYQSSQVKIFEVNYQNQSAASSEK